jgi:Txe/YoeB family toxin of toxin-antitoxin system
MYRIIFTKHAQKDAIKIKGSGLKPKTENLLKIIKVNPFENYPPFEKLIGDFEGCYSRRINLQHRLVYQVYETEKIIKVLRMWSHYGDN